MTIRTPEGVTFNLVLAGPISRSLAWLLDAAAIIAAAMVLIAVLSALGKLSADISGAIFLVAMFVVNLGYAMVLEWFWNGQTLGKRLLGLRVMDVRGLRLQPYQIIIRNLLRAVDSLPAAYLVGGLTSLFNRYAQRLGDLAANTIVIRERRVVEPDLDVILEKVHYNSLRDYPHLAARLRQQAAPEEAELALQALMRRDALTPEARVALFEELAAHFRQKVTFPQEALEGVSDEQYVRNVVDVLFKAA
ncbi:MAG: RDD family protein [Desulfobacteraceae bacterium]